MKTDIEILIEMWQSEFGTYGVGARDLERIARSIPGVEDRCASSTKSGFNCRLGAWLRRLAKSNTVAGGYRIVLDRMGTTRSGLRNVQVFKLCQI